MSHQWSQSVEFGQKIWTRKLGTSETAYYLFGEYCAASDHLLHVALDVSFPLVEKLESEAYVHDAWLRFKRRIPILAATVRDEEGRDGVPTPSFHITEDAFRHVAPEEIRFHVGTRSYVRNLVSSYFNGRRTVSSNCMVSLDVVREEGSQRNFHMIIHYNHTATDAMSIPIVAKTLLEELAAPTERDYLEDLNLNVLHSLEKHQPIDSFYSHPSWSSAKKRWKAAMATVIYNYRQSKSLVGVYLSFLNM
jgi:hypothetical protein